MFPDALQLFSDAQALTASAASSSVLNMKAASRLGAGKPLAVFISIDVAADGTTTDETYAVKLQCDDADTFGSATDIISRTIGYASLTAGSVHTLPIPPELNVEQYLRLYYTLGGTTPTVTVTAWLAPMDSLQNWKPYPKNYNV